MAEMCPRRPRIGSTTPDTIHPIRVGVECIQVTRHYCFDIRECDKVSLASPV